MLILDTPKAKSLEVNQINEFPKICSEVNKPFLVHDENRVNVFPRVGKKVATVVRN